MVFYDTNFLKYSGYYCGPASLHMILKFYNCTIYQDQLPQWAGTKPGSGTSHEGLRKATQNAGSAY